MTSPHQTSPSRLASFKAALNKQTVLTAISYFCALFYPFNNTISDRILFGKYNPYIFDAIAIVAFLLAKKQRFSKKYLLIVLTLIVALGLITINNQFILNNDQLGSFITHLIYIFTAIFVFGKGIDQKIFLTVMKIFCIEHIVGTLIPIVLPNFYSNTVLPFMCNNLKNECTAAYNFRTGSNAGLTTHYTTNGIYAAIFSILFFADYSSTKKKSNLIFSVIPFSLLFIIGKRAHLLFTAISILTIYVTGIYNTKTKTHKKNHKLLKIFSIAIAGVLSITILSQFIPNISSTINRIASSQDGASDILNGRSPLYDVAIKSWKESPIFGNGWGSYVFRANNAFGSTTYGYGYMHAHNDFLEILCDTGIVGLTLYTLLLFYLLKKSFIVLRHQKSPSTLALFAATYLIFHILYSFTGSPIRTISTLLFFIVSTCILYYQTKETTP